jgi:hypothetical protein
MLEPGVVATFNLKVRPPRASLTGKLNVRCKSTARGAPNREVERAVQEHVAVRLTGKLNVRCKSTVRCG